MTRRSKSEFNPISLTIDESNVGVSLKSHWDKIIDSAIDGIKWAVEEEKDVVVINKLDPYKFKVSIERSQFKLFLESQFKGYIKDENYEMCDKVDKILKKL